MIKILLHLTLFTTLVHAAERTHYIPPATTTENTTDLFDDIINQWDPRAADVNTAQSNDESKTSVSNNSPRANFSEFCLQPKENNKAPGWCKNTECVKEISKLVLASHKKTQNNLVQCFTSWFGIVNYIKDTKVDSRFACPICQKTQVNALRVAGCYLKHWNMHAFECKKCNIDLKSYEQFRDHRKKCVNSGLSVHSSSNTNAPRVTPGDDIEREKKRIDAALQKITCCGTSLYEWAVAQNHISKNHKKGVKKYMCPYCNVQHNTNVKALECFMKNKDNTIFTCQACELDCMTREKLLEHAKFECKSSEVSNQLVSIMPLPDQVSGQGSPFGNAFGTPNLIINPDYTELLPLVDQPTAEYQIPSTQEQYQSLDNLYYQLPNNNFYSYNAEQQTSAEQIIHTDDYYMPSSVNNEIIDRSINEYHEYNK